MDSNSVYGLELLVLEGTGGKALATDHRVNYKNAFFFCTEDGEKKGSFSLQNHDFQYVKEFTWAQTIFSRSRVAVSCKNSFRNLFFKEGWLRDSKLWPWLKKIIWVIWVLRKTVVCDWRFDKLCGSHLQSKLIVLVSWKIKNPGERFDWSIDRVAIGKCVMWLAVKTCAEMGYANRWVVK